jgi:hypothetical protein
MSEQTGIANSIDIAKQEAQYDSCAKKLLSNNIILAWILKECVQEFKQYSVAQIANDCIEGEPQVSKVAVDQDQLDKDELEYLEDMSDKSIEGKNTEDNSIKEGKVFYDIKFSAVVPDTKEPVQLFINVEAQKDDKTPYPLIKRGLYYVSRMISAQKNTVFTKSHYEKIRKVYSIWIQLNVDEHENSITKYRVSEEQVVGDYHELETNYDLLTVLMLKLGPADGAENHPILKLLDVLLSPDTKPDEKKTILERDFDIPMTKSMREEADAMCNLGQGIRETTEFRTKLQSIIDIMDSSGNDIEWAMKLIKIKPEDYELYKKGVEDMLCVK